MSNSKTPRTDGAHAQSMGSKYEALLLRNTLAPGMHLMSGAEIGSVEAAKIEAILRQTDALERIADVLETLRGDATR